MNTNITLKKLTVVFLLVTFAIGFNQTANAQNSNTRPLSVSVVVKDESCHGAKDVELTLTATGGFAPYSYSIDDGRTFHANHIFQNLTPGQVFYVAVRDSRGNVAKNKTEYLRPASAITLSINYKKDASCSSSKDGQINLGAYGGKGILTYSIDGGLTYPYSGSSTVVQGLSEGTYRVIAKDENGCTSQMLTARVGAKNDLKVVIDYSQRYDCRAIGGRLTFRGDGGVLPHSYFINGEPSPRAVVGLAPGKYVLTVVDAVGCSASREFEMEAPYTAILSGDTTVDFNASVRLKITVTDAQANKETRYRITGNDSNGQPYVFDNVPAGDYIATMIAKENITFQLLTVERLDNTKCKGYAGGTATIKVFDSHVWLGQNSDWNNIQNWSTKTVPNATSRVVIGVTPNNPVILGGASVKNIFVGEGAKVTIKGSMTVTGDIESVDKSSIDASIGTINFSGQTPQVFTTAILQGFAVKDLVIANDVILNDSLNVFGRIKFPLMNKTLHTGDMLTLKSNENGSGSVGRLINGNQISGEVIVEQYIAPKRGWKFLSVPTISSQTIHEAWQEGQEAGNTTGISGYGIQLTSSASDWQKRGFDSKSAAPSIKTYNPATGQYEAVASTLVPFNNNSNAYMTFVRGDRSANAINSPVTPTVLRNKGILKTGDQEPVQVAPGKFTPVGNPYASEIDMAKLNASADMFFYVWDPKLGNSYGAYQTFVKVGRNQYMAVPGGGTYNTLSENVIPAGQSFFAYHASGGTIQITENSKRDMAEFGQAREMGTEEESTPDRMKLKLYSVIGGQENLVDGLLQNIASHYADGVDEFDAIKSSNSTENLSIKRAGKLLAVESKSMSEYSDTTVLNMTGMGKNTYRFSIEFNQVQREAYDLVLIDKFTNASTIIKNGEPTIYEFSVSNVAASSAANRFNIVLVNRRPAPVTITSVKAERKEQNIQVSWTTENEKNVAQYEVQKSDNGQNFTTIGQVKAAQMQGYTFVDAKPFSGVNYYRIVSVDIDGKTGYSNIVKVSAEQVAGSLAVSPNPIVGNQINLQLHLQAKGIYYISVKNQLGQPVDNRQIEFSGQSNLVINPSQNLSRGAYTIEVVSPSGERSVVRFIK